MPPFGAAFFCASFRQRRKGTAGHPARAPGKCFPLRLHILFPQGAG